MEKNKTQIDEMKPPTAPPVDLQQIRREVMGDDVGSRYNPIVDGSAGELEAVRLYEKKRRELTLAQTPTPRLLTADEQIKAKRKEIAALEAAKEEERSNIARFHGMLETRDELERQLRRADEQFAILFSPEAKLNQIAEGWQSKDVSCNAQFQQYMALGAIERMRAEFPKWRETYVDRIEAFKQKIQDFVAEHNIQTESPATPPAPDPSEYEPKRYTWPGKN